MDSENIALVGGIGAGAGAVASQSGILPLVSGKGLIPIAFGLAVAGIGYFVMKADYISEGLIGVGVGWTLNAVL